MADGRVTSAPGHVDTVVPATLYGYCERSEKQDVWKEMKKRIRHYEMGLDSSVMSAPAHSEAAVPATLGVHLVCIEQESERKIITANCMAAAS